jgi:hypothetical protein
MRSAYCAWGLASLGLLVGLVLVLQVPAAAKSPAAQPDPANAVDLFSAIDKGQVDVKVIPKDSSQLRVMIENKTDKPLTVKLPDAFAAVPVLAQNAAPARNNNANKNNNNQNQGMGGGMGMGGMGGGGMGMGGMGGMMNIAPEKVGQFKVATVCLDHGKGEPRAAIPYVLKPLEDYTTQAGVREVCEMLGNGKINQRVAQVCVWHLNNGLTWEHLSAKQLRFADGSSRPYFTQQELQAAMQVSAAAVQLAKQRSEEKPSSSSSSISQR